MGAFRAEMPRRGEIPTFRWGKHSVRLYAGRTRRGKAPAPPAPRGRKEFNLETLFAYRQAVGFRPNTPEPEESWMGELASELVRLGRSIEEADDLPPLPAPPAWTESKQRQREALKKLALGQKLSRGQSWQQTMW